MVDLYNSKKLVREMCPFYQSGGWCRYDYMNVSDYARDIYDKLKAEHKPISQIDNLVHTCNYDQCTRWIDAVHTILKSNDLCTSEAYSNAVKAINDSKNELQYDEICEKLNSGKVLVFSKHKDDVHILYKTDEQINCIDYDNTSYNIITSDDLCRALSNDELRELLKDYKNSGYCKDHLNTIAIRQAFKDIQIVDALYKSAIQEKQAYLTNVNHINYNVSKEEYAKYINKYLQQGYVMNVSCSLKALHAKYGIHSYLFYIKGKYHVFDSANILGDDVRHYSTTCAKELFDNVYSLNVQFIALPVLLHENQMFNKWFNELCNDLIWNDNE